MQRFENVDLLSALERIMKTNTEHYQSDFVYDIKTIQAAAARENPIDKTLLWLSRRNGTHCYFESDVFLKGSSANTGWKYWNTEKESILAYALVVKETRDGIIYGDLFSLDFNEHCKSVRKNSVKADTQVVHYENKDIPMDAGKYFTIQNESVYGKYLGTEVLPNDPEQLKTVLDNEKRKRDGFPLGDIEKHIKELESGRKPSIRKQLADNKAKTDKMSKQQKSKNKELEV